MRGESTDRGYQAAGSGETTPLVNVGFDSYPEPEENIWSHTCLAGALPGLGHHGDEGSALHGYSIPTMGRHEEVVASTTPDE